MRLERVYPPKDVTPADDDAIVTPTGRFEGFYGPNDERYERLTQPNGTIEWFRLVSNEEA